MAAHFRESMPIIVLGGRDASAGAMPTGVHDKHALAGYKGVAVRIGGRAMIDCVVERLEHFETAIVARPEVMECYLMTGESDYLLRVVVPDIAAYQAFLLDHLTRIDGIASIKSSFALKQVKYKTALPLDHLEEL